MNRLLAEESPADHSLGGNEMARLGFVAVLLGAACGLLPACTSANGVPELEKITVAEQDTTPPQFAAFVSIDTGQQLSPTTTAGGTGFATTVGPSVSPQPEFVVFTPGDDLAIVVNAFDDESGVQMIDIRASSGSAPCTDGDLGSGAVPGLLGKPAALGKNASVKPGDEVLRVAFGRQKYSVRPGDKYLVYTRATDNYGNASEATFTVEIACRAA
jgi:hypothetical protein